MAETMTEEKSTLARRLPLIAVVAVAIIGAFTLKDYLSFETLRENREALLAFRDSNYLLTVLIFMAAYIVIVAFSLPGATIATLTEANENKEAQLTSLQEMIEVLLAEREANGNTAANKMRNGMSSFRDRMREGANAVKESVRDRSSHGGVFGGSQHGGTFGGSQHGGTFGGSP